VFRHTKEDGGGVCRQCVMNGSLPAANEGWVVTVDQLEDIRQESL